MAIINDTFRLLIQDDIPEEALPKDCRKQKSVWNRSCIGGVKRRVRRSEKADAIMEEIFEACEDEDTEKF